jgi:fucose permease
LTALTNSHASKFLSLGLLLVLSATLQLLSQCLRPWKPPFPLFAVTVFLTGLGQAYQDSHANTFVTSVPDAHNWLGFIHAMYGLGCLVAPFVATAVASANEPSRWMLYYLFPLGLSVINVISVVVAFRDSIHLIPRTLGSSEIIEESGGRNKSAMRELRQLMKLRSVWIISLFFFFYLGVGVTSCGT